MYIYNHHSAVHRKQIQSCKSTILQLKIIYEKESSSFHPSVYHLQDENLEPSNLLPVATAPGIMPLWKWKCSCSAASDSLWPHGAHQAPPSMGFSRQEYWSGLPFPSPGNLPDPGIEPRSPALQADALTSEPQESPSCPCTTAFICRKQVAGKWWESSSLPSSTKSLSLMSHSQNWVPWPFLPKGKECV